MFFHSSTLIFYSLQSVFINTIERHGVFVNFEKKVSCTKRDLFEKVFKLSNVFVIWLFVRFAYFS